MTPALQKIFWSARRRCHPLHRLHVILFFSLRNLEGAMNSAMHTPAAEFTDTPSDQLRKPLKTIVAIQGIGDRCAAAPCALSCGNPQSATTHRSRSCRSGTSTCQMRAMSKCISSTSRSLKVSSQNRLTRQSSSSECNNSRQLELKSQRTVQTS